MAAEVLMAKQRRLDVRNAQGTVQACGSQEFAIGVESNVSDCVRVNVGEIPIFRVTRHREW